MKPLHLLSPASIRNLGSLCMGTCSYLYPFREHNMAKNLRLIAPSVNTIQLLFFSRDWTAELLDRESLAAYAEAQQIMGHPFVVHLPLDLPFMHPQQHNIDELVDVVERIMQQLSEITVSRWILHLDCGWEPQHLAVNTGIAGQKRVELVLDKLMQRDSGLPERLCIENTGYDLRYFAPAILERKFGVCLDFGHLGIAGLSAQAFHECFDSAIRVYHLHGWRESKDHIGLSVLTDQQRQTIMKILAANPQPTILEVFSRKVYDDCARAFSQWNSVSEKP